MAFETQSDYYMLWIANKFVDVWECAYMVPCYFYWSRWVRTSYASATRLASRKPPRSTEHFPSRTDIASDSNCNYKHFIINCYPYLAVFAIRNPHYDVSMVSIWFLNESTWQAACSCATKRRLHLHTFVKWFTIDIHIHLINGILLSTIRIDLR